MAINFDKPSQHESKNNFMSKDKNNDINIDDSTQETSQLKEYTYVNTLTKNLSTSTNNIILS